MKEFNVVLEKEERFLALKSRLQWLQQGERNSKFFHLSLVFRRRRNKISMLRDEQGNWVTDQNQLKNMVVEFFKNLYSVGSAYS